ncbi:MAG: M48 family metallopeptidase [Deltaproteobacteria bacterium]|nr:M48 family metallopeptidase [Deltaproteobacteria bacterium]
MMTETVVAVFLGLYLLHFAVETGLDGLNLIHTGAGQGVPPHLEGQVDAETAAKSREYTLARLRLGLVERAVTSAVTLAVLLGGFLPFLEQWVGAMILAIAGPPAGGAHLAPHFSVWFLMALGGVYTLAGLPFSIWGTFVIEQRYGFNRQTLAGWLGDRLKGLLLVLVLLVPLLYGVVWFMEASREGWWLWVFGLVTGFQLLMVWLVPMVIAPWFNTFTPLEDQELLKKVEALAEQGGFKAKGVFVMDASRRSGHSNAYFTGFGRAKRIVLFDTLLAHMEHDETQAVLAHEIGHYQAGHVKKRMVLNMAVTLVLLFIASRVAGYPQVFEAFGLGGGSPHGLLALLALCGGAFTFWFSPLFAWISRRHEYEADRYSVKAVGKPQALKTALLRLSRENLSNPVPHPWYAAYHYSHPPLARRLAALTPQQSPVPA